MLTMARKCFAMLDRPARRGLSGLAIMIALGSILEAVSIGVLFPVIKVILDPGEMAGVPWIGDQIKDSDSAAVAPVLIAGLILLFVAKNGFLIFLTFRQNLFISLNQARFACEFLRRFLAAPYEVVMKRTSADVVTLLDDTISRVYQTAISAFLVLATEFLVLAGIGIVLVFTDPLLTLGAVVVVGGVGLLSYMWLRPRLSAWGEESLSLRREVLQAQQQSVAAVREIKMYGVAGQIEADFAGIRHAFGRLTGLRSAMGQVPRFVIETALVMVILGGLASLLWAERTPAEISAVLGVLAASAIRIMPSSNRILLSSQQLRFCAFAVDKLYDEFRSSEAWLRSASPGEDKAAASPGGTRLLTLEGLGYRFAGADRAAIEDLNVTIPHGASIGIVGPSGAGKSTLAMLLMGLLRPQQGRVLVDGKAIGDRPLSSRLRVGYVPQNVVLLNDTLRRNIAFGVPDSEIDDTLVVRAIRGAALNPVVEKLPQGLQTVLGEHGSRLSGGEGQRVGIARALYRDAELIVLDEATAALDNESERRLIDTIDGLRGQKTVVVIAHRLSTVRRCDQILFMHDGRLRDQGSFDELRQRNLDFRRLVDLGDLGQPLPDTETA
ncbi:MAG: ABC transporter ATP-binding protein [Hyphomicrobiales bacterium]|nr:ABC transporter ATP-binding protein [Hyphomicrobiales bacterium]MCP5370541.1 ABC transporter ATP-binding protein [Hyphomicrobiales bacterium]